VDNEDTDESDDERASDDDDATPKKGTRGKSKKTTNGTKGAGAATPVGKQPTRARLEQEYVFMGVVSTFLRAIRAGAIHPSSLSTHGR